MQIKAAPACFRAISFHRDPQYWREQACKAWAAADRFHEPRLREAMARVAVGYEQLADTYGRLASQAPTPAMTFVRSQTFRVG